MKSCPRTSQITAWHDGRLAPDAALELQQHMDECPLCRTQGQSLDQIHQSVVNATLAKPSDQAMQRWMRIPQHQRAEDRGLRHLVGWMTAAAAGLLLVCGLWSLNDSAHAQPILGDMEYALLNPSVEPVSSMVLEARLITADLAAASSGGPQP